MADEDFEFPPQSLWERFQDRVVPFWMMREWWQYVLDDSRCDTEYGPFVIYCHSLPEFIPERIAERFDFEVRNPFKVFGNYLARCLCRARNHPAGVVWYSSGYEPDMTCRECGEDLG